MLRGHEFDSIDYLVIGDRDLLVMADIFDLAIVTAAQFLQIRSIIDLNTAID
jgi:predicted nucleic acid-binding protein